MKLHINNTYNPDIYSIRGDVEDAVKFHIDNWWTTIRQSGENSSVHRLIFVVYFTVEIMRTNRLEFSKKPRISILFLYSTDSSVLNRHEN
jgi:hypothetical protein